MRIRKVTNGYWLLDIPAAWAREPRHGGVSGLFPTGEEALRAARIVLENIRLCRSGSTLRRIP